MSKMSRSEAGRLGAQKTKQLWLNRYAANYKCCTHCKKQLPYEKRHNEFCDHCCAAKYNNDLKEKKEKACIQCGNVICDYKFWQTRKYCSRQCQADYRWEQIKKRFVESGVMPARTTAKKYLAEVCGNRCSVCGIDEWMGKPVLLILDHIDGNSSNCTIGNFRLVCSNCDAQLPTYKGKNKGNGRHYRKIRYQDGKSY